MTVLEIIRQVRWCIDEESNNTSDIAETVDEKDDAYMDHIIKAKIPDALHWIAITAASSAALSGSTSAIFHIGNITIPTGTKLLNVEPFDEERQIGKITMPSDLSVFNINRVRCDGWFKAVIPNEDTSDDALEMFDESAKGTADRPQAVIMRQEPLALLIQPMPTDNFFASVSYVGIPNGIDTDEDGNESVDIPTKFRSAFIYYIAFLLLSAYDDTKANQMYSIAMQQLGAQTSKS